MKKNRPWKRSKDASIDGFVRNDVVKRRPLGAKLSHDRISGKHAKDETDEQFEQPDGFNSGADGTKNIDIEKNMMSRRPIKKSDIDMEIDETATPKKGFNKKKRRKRSKKQKAMIAIGALVVIGLLIMGFLYWRARQVFSGGENALALNCDVDPALLNREGDGRVNVLIMGKGGIGHEGADLTDTILIASLDSCQKEVGLLSIPRDLYVETPGYGLMKINALYANAKQSSLSEGKSEKDSERFAIKTIEDKIEEVTSLPINYHAMVDFTAFRKAIDTVGGVDVDVKERLYDETVAWKNNGDPLIADVGTQHMEGEKALLYARSRYGSARGDFDRSIRQREVLVALRNKIFSLGTFGNPIKLSQLLSAFGDHIQTNLNIDDLSKIYTIGGEIEGDRVHSIGLADEPNNFITTDTYYGQSVVVPLEGVFEYSKIHAYLRNELRDGFLKKEDASVAVYNGTKNPGLAKQYADKLKSYGYKVVEVGDAPSKDNAKTTLYDLNNGDKKYTKRYLELRTKSMASSDLPDGIAPEVADFVIIIGEN